MRFPIIYSLISKLRSGISIEILGGKIMNTKKTTYFISIADIISVALFYIALFINTISSEGFGFGLLIVTLILSILCITVFNLYSVICVIRKKKEKTKVFFATHIVNFIWLISIILLLSSVKIMGASFF